MGLDLATLLKSYRLHLRAGRRSPHTLNTYTSSIQIYIDWLTAQGIEPTIENATRDSLRAWLIELQENYSPATAHTRFSSVSRFTKWLVKEGEIDTDPANGITVPRAKPPNVPVLTDEQLKALIDSCDNKTIYGRRDEAIIRVLLSTGIRVSELCNLNTADIDLDASTAAIIGKGEKPRTIHFSTRTLAAIDRYMRARIRQGKSAEEPALFLTQRGRIRPATVREMLKTRGQRVGINGLHPHQFRHTFAHDFLMAGGQERDLKRLAGWSSNMMLERYGASAADARAVHAAERLNRGDRV